MKKHIIFIATLLAMTLSSCSDWLDVRGENIEKEENQFIQRLCLCTYRSLYDHGQQQHLWRADDYDGC